MRRQIVLLASGKCNYFFTSNLQISYKISLYDLSRKKLCPGQFRRIVLNSVAGSSEQRLTKASSGRPPSNHCRISDRVAAAIPPRLPRKTTTTPSTSVFDWATLRYRV